MEIDIETGAAILTVVSPKHGIFRVLVDQEDRERVGRHKWSVTRRENITYFKTATRNPDGSMAKLRLHRFIMNAPEGLDVDHINHNYLDCRKSELRICTRKQNTRNMRKDPGTSSRYKGVCLNARYRKWVSRVRVDGRLKHLGCFPPNEQGEIDAAMAYDVAAVQNFGAFALLNFPIRQEAA